MSKIAKVVGIIATVVAVAASIAIPFVGAALAATRRRNLQALEVASTRY
jgi:N-acetylmuramic acid 6-phosphate (MurNAc-6-P) etherase